MTTFGLVELAGRVDALHHLVYNRADSPYVAANAQNLARVLTEWEIDLAIEMGKSVDVRAPMFAGSL